MPQIFKMKSKELIVQGSTVSVDASVEEDDVNGQHNIKVVATLDGDTLEKKASIGAGDGKDALTELTQQQVQDAMQKIIDDLRIEAAKLLVHRAKIRSAAPGLI